MRDTNFQKGFILLAFGLLMAGLFLHLGKQPLYLEEPRRAIIAMEMAERGNFWIPTELGEYYYNKPPVFNWVLMGSASLFGGFHEWAMRLPTVLSTLGIITLMWFMGRRYVDEHFGLLSGLIFATCGSVLLFFSQLGEIDLFYALISLAGFAVLFHGYEQRQWWWMFGGFYAFHAIGMLTKGLPSVVFIGLTLPAWLWYKKDLKRLTSVAHVGGIILFVIITGGYLYQYSHFNSLEPLLKVWLGQAGERTVAEQGIQRLLGHLLLYPLDTLKDLLPFSLLIVFVWRKDIFQVLKRNEWVMYSALVTAVNFPVYWISPGAKQRYLYMFFPLILAVCLWMWRNAEASAPKKVFRMLSGIFLVLVACGGTAMFFLPQFGFLSGGIAMGVIAGFCFLILLGWWKKQDHKEIHAMILAMMILRIIFDLTIIPLRARDSGARTDQLTAFQIDSIVGKSPLYFFRNDRCSFNTIYYLNRLRGECLQKSYEIQDGAFYIADVTCIEVPFQCYWEFEYDKRSYVLFQFSALRD